MTQLCDNASDRKLRAGMSATLFNLERTGKLTKAGHVWYQIYNRTIFTHGGIDNLGGWDLRILFPCIEKLSHNLFKDQTSEI